jgi:hypothetical protein
MLKKGLPKFPHGIPPHPKYSSLRIACFVLHPKVPSPEIDTIHQFISIIDQFCCLWCVDLSPQSHGTKKNLFLVGSQINSHGISSLVLVPHNFSG